MFIRKFYVQETRFKDIEYIVYLDYDEEVIDTYFSMNSSALAFPISNLSSFGMFNCVPIYFGYSTSLRIRQSAFFGYSFIEGTAVISYLIDETICSLNLSVLSGRTTITSSLSSRSVS